MRVCIIGNSHTGSLMRAWQNNPEWHTETELDIFAAPGDMLKSLEINNSYLLASTDSLRSAIEFTSGGKTEIYPDGYDVILVYGLDSRPYFKSGGIYSEAVFQQSIEDHCKSSLSFSILKLITGLTSNRVFLGHQPLFSVNHENGEPVFPDCPKEQYIVGCELMNTRFYRQIGVELVRQPLCTIVNGRYTGDQYCRGSRRLPVGVGSNEGFHPSNDRVHMNDEYGQLWMESFFLDYLDVSLSHQGEFNKEHDPPQCQRTIS